MIRYVVAALLAVAIVSVAGLALDDGAADNTERELQTGISDIEDAAIELSENEELSPDTHPDPRRVVDFRVPTGSLTEAGVSHLEIEPVAGADASFARYVLTDGTDHREIIEVRIVYRDATDARTTEIRGSGTQMVTLVLRPDADGDPVVVVDPPE
ncbi:DUF7311 family protein [Natrarchaeobaculum sulfurireducens]|uniref:Pilin/flagellin n=1 Tax=Natrarchaeobaculum sulfurireducens TaxID=2044521 RepID=A0A346PFN0_9EURY|nr:hypothetical protein [Natrarchaeobaculum sulfurireducens]AXR78325.1 Pilin/flagellin [Natrarchaeobaculum sulfurireducens]AXR81644.1 hypothetical protein AArcMg_1632 [Natrarchaeobaculum sulfurireducens]